MSTQKRSIKTEYAGITFRSKLEADWARMFDALGIRWDYEPKGRYFGNQFYLVDFYLPMSRQWVEVKGVFEPDDVRKIVAFLEHVAPRPHTSDSETCPDIAMVACEPGWVFRGWERGVCKRSDSLLDLSRKACHELALMQCGQCHGWWFADTERSWRCQCCGFYEGNSHISECLESPLRELPTFNAITSIAADD